MSEPTPQAEKLYNALMGKKVVCRREPFDGKKHVDIAIPGALIDIEVDGWHHWTNPEQIMADYKRSFWSLVKFWKVTLHVPNYIIDNDVESVADAISAVAKKREGEIKNKLLKRFHLSKRQEKQAKQF